MSTHTIVCEPQTVCGVVYVLVRLSRTIPSFAIPCALVCGCRLEHEGGASHWRRERCGVADVDGNALAPLLSKGLRVLCAVARARGVRGNCASGRRDGAACVLGVVKECVAGVLVG